MHFVCGRHTPITPILTDDIFPDPSEQNTIDKLIQKIQGTPMGGMVRRLIKRNIEKRE